MTYANERRACTAAVLFRGALERTKEELAGRGDCADRARVAGLGYRVGIHCGVAYCGSIGYEARADYTACGSEVNIASRIEAQADVYGVPALVSGSVADRVRDDFCCVPLDVVRLRGQSTAKTRLYHLVEIMGKEEEEEEEERNKCVNVIRERFYEIHRLTRTRQYPRAVELIWRTLGDSAFRCYEKSLNVLLKNIQKKSRKRHRSRERKSHRVEHGSTKVTQIKRTGLN